MEWNCGRSFHVCVFEGGGLIQSSVQSHEGQKVQLACNYFLFQLQNSLGMRHVLMELKSNLCANRSRFIPCVSSSQYICILDRGRIPCPIPRRLVPSLGHMGPHCSIPFCKLCLRWSLSLPARIALLIPFLISAAATGTWLYSLYLYSLFSLWCLTLPQVKY